MGGDHNFYHLHSVISKVNVMVVCRASRQTVIRDGVVLCLHNDTRTAQSSRHFNFGIQPRAAGLRLSILLYFYFIRYITILQPSSRSYQYPTFDSNLTN